MNALSPGKNLDFGPISGCPSIVTPQSEWLPIYRRDDDLSLLPRSCVPNLDRMKVRTPPQSEMDGSVQPSERTNKSAKS